MGASALLPFPIAHPRDRCARTKLELNRPSASKQSHLAHGQGIEVIVEAGAPRPCHLMGPNTFTRSFVEAVEGTDVG